MHRTMMRAAAGFIVSVVVFSATPALASSFQCKGTYNKQIAFELRTSGRFAFLSTPDSHCKTVIDPRYRPTAKYEGYKRFEIQAGKFEACRELSEELLGKGNVFDSIKVSPELQNGEAQGLATFIYDYGDYHGRLANDYVVCDRQ